MNKTTYAVFLALLFAACSSGGEQQQVTAEEEAEIVDAINADLESAQNELESAAEENLAEIDSLLENVE